MSKKIGIFGGTFDPPHLGHLKIANKSIKRLKLDSLIFVPCYKHLLKESEPSASPYERSNMVALMTLRNKRFLISNFELERGGITYTIETLKYLKGVFGSAEFYLIMGSDTYKTFENWREPVEIRRLSTLVVFKREITQMEKKDEKDIIFNIKPIEISSTMIRERIRGGIDCKRFLIPAVYKYIMRNKIYFKGEG